MIITFDYNNLSHCLYNDNIVKNIEIHENVSILSSIPYSSFQKNGYCSVSIDINNYDETHCHIYYVRGFMKSKLFKNIMREIKLKRILNV